MKKKSMKPEPGKKQVRIDHKTIIFVDENIPDKQAIANWHEKMNYSASVGGRKKSFKRKNDEISHNKDEPL